MARYIDITLVKSGIGSPTKLKLVLRGLGLRRLHHTVRREDSRAVRGMINKVPHLVRCTLVTENAAEQGERHP
ncbi:MAG: 50S ribosomal protein L30 [Candidatus Tectomicrobia bacterium]|nr:50S ribosomal protein L30 [Candidatus Tectomicrobia bacterium]